MNLKFYTSVAKVLKLKLRKFWLLIATFVEVTGKKLVGGLLPPFPSPPSLIGLRVLDFSTGFFTGLIYDLRPRDVPCASKFSNVYHFAILNTFGLFAKINTHEE